MRGYAFFGFIDSFFHLLVFYPFLFCTFAAGTHFSEGERPFLWVRITTRLLLIRNVRETWRLKGHALKGKAHSVHVVRGR